MKKTLLLFSYGTLQLEKVQLENYGRILYGERDQLPGYRLELLKITSKEVLLKSGKEIHPIAVRSKNDLDLVEGVLFEITEEELIQTDKYEVSQYQRILTTFKSGKKAWVYVFKNEAE